MSAFSQIQAVVTARLLAHSADRQGLLLRGLKFEANPVKEIDGETDFPQVRLFPSDASETVVLGNAPNCSLSMRLMTAVSRQQATMVDATELLEKALDAIETRADGTIDAGLEGTVEQPFSWKANGRATSLTYVMEAIITFAPANHPTRGGRRRVSVFIDATGSEIINAAGLVLGPK